MANARIEIVGTGELQLIARLYNRIFMPSVDESYFDRRLRYKHNVLMMVAALDRQPVGFSCGYELRPSTYYSWLYGVVPDARRLGVASQLLQAENSWAKDQGYEMIRLECYNSQKPMFTLAIRAGYDIVGIRYDSHTASNLVVFEKNLADDES